MSHRVSCEGLLFARAANAVVAADEHETIRIELYNEPLQAGLHHGGFERDDAGEWAQRRGGGSPRGSIKASHAAGVEGLVVIRGEGREYPIAVLGNNERSVVINGEGAQESPAAAFYLVVATMDLQR